MEQKTTVPTNEQEKRQILWQNWRSELYSRRSQKDRQWADLNRSHDLRMSTAAASTYAQYHQDKFIRENELAKKQARDLDRIYDRAVGLDTRLKNAITHGYNLSGFQREPLSYENCLMACENFMQEYGDVSNF